MRNVKGTEYSVLYETYTMFYENIWHIVLPGVVGLLFIGGAVSLFIGEQFALLALSIGELLCLAVGLHNTWTLTVWLVLHRGQSPSEGEHTSVSEDDIVG